jgi:hypothetical protein
MRSNIASDQFIARHDIDDSLIAFLAIVMKRLSNES